MAEKNNRSGENSFKVQSTVEPYTQFVLDSLVGIKGRSVSDVVNFILKQWIGDHAKELEDYDINFRRAKEGGIL